MIAGSEENTRKKKKKKMKGKKKNARICAEGSAAEIITPGESHSFQTRTKLESFIWDRSTSN